MNDTQPHHTHQRHAGTPGGPLRGGRARDRSRKIIGPLSAREQEGRRRRRKGNTSRRIRLGERPDPGARNLARRRGRPAGALSPTPPPGEALASADGTPRRPAGPSPERAEPPGGEKPEKVAGTTHGAQTDGAAAARARPTLRARAARRRSLPEGKGAGPVRETGAGSGWEGARHNELTPLPSTRAPALRAWAGEPRPSSSPATASLPLLFSRSPPRGPEAGDGRPVGGSGAADRPPDV